MAQKWAGVDWTGSGGGEQDQGLGFVPHGSPRLSAESDRDMPASYTLSLLPAPLPPLSSYPRPVPEYQARPNFSAHPAICPLGPVLPTQKVSTRLPQGP